MERSGVELSKLLCYVFWKEKENKNKYFYIFLKKNVYGVKNIGFDKF